MHSKHSEMSSLVFVWALVSVLGCQKEILMTSDNKLGAFLDEPRRPSRVPTSFFVIFLGCSSGQTC